MKFVQLITDDNVVHLANFLESEAESHPILHACCMDYLRKAVNANNPIIKLEDLNPEIADYL